MKDDRVYLEHIRDALDDIVVYASPDLTDRPESVIHCRQNGHPVRQRQPIWPDAILATGLRKYERTSLRRTSRHSIMTVTRSGVIDSWE